MQRIIILFLIVLAMRAHAQPPAAMVEAMRKLSFLEGIWKGQGWIQAATGKQHFNETETVNLKVGNTLMQIGVHGTAIGNDSSIINNGLAIVTYDTLLRKYHIVFYQADGSMVHGDVELKGEHSIQINLERSKGYTRFLIEIRENKWFEKAFSSKDGLESTQFFEMTLHKQ